MDEFRNAEVDEARRLDIHNQSGESSLRVLNMLWTHVLCNNTQRRRGADV